jgi:2'-5' RNA ligase
MVTKEISIPGYEVADYMIVLNPHQELRNKIEEVKAGFAKEYKATAGFGANMLLASFSQYEMMEERILNRLKNIALGCPPFKVEMKDFGSFPSHTIYFRVTSKIPVQNLVKKIRSEAQRLMKLDDENKPYFNLEPHITIARKLKPWQYEKGWLEFSTKSFTGRFIADEMILLKRLQGETKWIVAKRFQFENMPITTKQGELFS